MTSLFKGTCCLQVTVCCLTNPFTCVDELMHGVEGDRNNK